MSETFTAKLDIRMVTPSEYAEMIEIGALASRTAICAIGAPGVGKSAIPRQVAQRRGAPYIALHIPQMAVEDFHVPTTAADSKRYYDRRIPRRFQDVLEFVDRMKEVHGGCVPEGKSPIIAIEEINRAVNKNVTQAAFTLLEDRMIGDTRVPDEVQLVVTMNPSGGAMTVNQFERDPAHRRRLLLVGVTASYPDFIEHARAAKFHPAVFEHLEAQPTLMYDEAAMLAGKAFACPASWETVSQVCYALDRAGVELASAVARALIAGKIGETATHLFLDFLADRSVFVTADDILRGYFEGSTVRERVQRMVSEGRHDKLTALLPNLAIKVFSDQRRRPETYGKQLSLFMEDLPDDALVAFMKVHLKNQADAVGGGRTYFTRLSAHMATDHAFNAAMKRYRRSEDNGEDEARRSGMLAANS